MSRTMSTQCRHGVTIAWGDFGPEHSCADMHGCSTDRWEPGQGFTGCSCPYVTDEAGCYACQNKPSCSQCDGDRAVRWAGAVERMRLVLAGTDRDLRRASDEEALLFVLALPASTEGDPT